MPAFLQLQFWSNWICSKPCSYEKRICKFKDGDAGTVKTWTKNQLPILFTPINTRDILRQHRLVVLVKLIEGKDEKLQENFAYCLIDFGGLKLKKSDSNHYETTVKGSLVGYNSVLGEFECIILFEIEGA